MDQISNQCQVGPGVEPCVRSGMRRGFALRPVVSIHTVYQRVYDVFVPRRVVRYYGHCASVHGGLHACVQHMDATKDGIWWGCRGEREQWGREV